MSRGDVYGRSLARLYDLFYGAKPYRAESRFLSGILRENGVVQGERLLELACGTGGHALELAKAGFLVTGVDRSAAMLGEARRKAAGRGHTVVGPQELIGFGGSGERFLRRGGKRASGLPARFPAGEGMVASSPSPQKKANPWFSTRGKVNEH